jgi:hypothetical protein
VAVNRTRLLLGASVRSRSKCVSDLLLICDTVAAEHEFLTQLIRKYATVQISEPGLYTYYLNVILPSSYFTLTKSVIFPLKNYVSIHSPAVLAVEPVHCYHLHFTVLTIIRVIPVHVMKTHEGMDVHLHLFLTSERDCVSGKLCVPAALRLGRSVARAHRRGWIRPPEPVWTTGEVKSPLPLLGIE